MDDNLKNIFVPLRGYEGLYSINVYGDIKSHSRFIETKTGRRWKKGRVLAASCSRYKFVRLCKDGSRPSFLVHRLVAHQFLPPIKGKPCVNHKDGVKTNNDIENLEWCSQRENVQHSINNGLTDCNHGESNTQAKLSRDDVVEIYRAGKDKSHSRKKLSEKYNVDVATIYSIIAGKSWKRVTDAL